MSNGLSKDYEPPGFSVLALRSGCHSTVVVDNVLLLYSYLIKPYMTYCISAWGCANRTIINKILTLQKRALRLITNSEYRAPSAPIFN